MRDGSAGAGAVIRAFGRMRNDQDDWHNASGPRCVAVGGAGLWVAYRALTAANPFINVSKIGPERPLQLPDYPDVILERANGFEPSTPTLARL